jgi:hypothetical protein
VAFPALLSYAQLRWGSDVEALRIGGAVMKIFPRIQFAAAVLAAVFSTLTCATMFAADAKPTAEVLGRRVGGKWTGDGALLDSDYSQAMKVSGITTCAWSPDHVFVVCDQALTVSGKPVRQFSVYGYDPDAGKFHFYGLSPSADKARTPDLVITAGGQRWEYDNTEEIKGKPVRFRTVNVFRDVDHVEWWSEYSADDGAHWTRMGEGKEARQP